MNLLEQILTDDESNFDFARNSSIVERKKATLGFIVQLLYEDFYCWIHCACDHSESIRNREEMPLIANILWPRSTIPVLNSNCRKLINFHISALVRRFTQFVVFKLTLNPSAIAAGPCVLHSAFGEHDGRDYPTDGAKNTIEISQTK